jgi:hypothetical protein
VAEACTTAPSVAPYHLEILVDGTPFIYAAAKVRCGTLLGGVLAKLDTLGDYELAKTLIAQYAFPNKQAWIGLNDLAQEGTFRWVETPSWAPSPSGARPTPITLTTRTVLS